MAFLICVGFSVYGVLQRLLYCVPAPLNAALCAWREIMNSKEVVLAFWDAMKTNDFAKASEWLSPDFEGFWPQSGELIVGRDNFTAINSFYPANGTWEFVVHSIVCDGENSSH